MLGINHFPNTSRCSSGSLVGSNVQYNPAAHQQRLQNTRYGSSSQHVLHRTVVQAASVEVQQTAKAPSNGTTPTPMHAPVTPANAAAPVDASSPDQSKLSTKKYYRRRRNKSSQLDQRSAPIPAAVASNSLVLVQIESMQREFQAMMRQQMGGMQSKLEDMQGQLQQVDGVQSQLASFQDQIQQLLQERELLRAVIKEELGISDLSRYKQGSKDPLGLETTHLQELPEIAASYAAAAKALQGDGKVEAMVSAQVADLITRSAYQLFAGSSLADTLSKSLLLDAAEAVAECGKEEGEIRAQLEISLSDTSAMLLELVADHPELKEAAADIASSGPQLFVEKILRKLPEQHSWAELVKDRSGNDWLQLKLQDLLLSTVFSKPQLALYIKAMYATQADNDDALAKGLLALHTLQSGLQFLELPEGLWVEMARGEEDRFRNVTLMEQRNLFTDGDVNSLYSLDTEYMGDTVKKIFCRNAYDGPDGEELYEKAYGDEIWAFNTWGEVQLNLYHLVTYGQKALREMEPSIKRAVTRRQGSLLRASALHPEGFADAVKRVLYAKGVDGW